jgi:micrococcal nuclease
MKKVACLLSLFVIVHLCIAQETITGKVVKIADGDTFTLLIAGNKQVKVRLYGIDCPESKQDFGSRAKQFTAARAFGKQVKVHVKNLDRYGRSIGTVILPDGKILNEELLRAGLAWHHKRYDKSQRFALLESQARSKKLGLWSAKRPVAPWEFKRARK